MPPPVPPPGLGVVPFPPPISGQELRVGFEKVAQVIINTESKMSFFIINWFLKLLVNNYLKIVIYLFTKPSHNTLIFYEIETDVISAVFSEHFYFCSKSLKAHK